MIDDQTDTRMADPQPGDRFSELCSYWVEVIARNGDRIIYRTYGSGNAHLATLDEFRARFRSSAGYWIHYHDRRGEQLDPSAWDAMSGFLAAEQRGRLTALSLNGAML